MFLEFEIGIFIAAIFIIAKQMILLPSVLKLYNVITNFLKSILEYILFFLILRRFLENVTIF